MFGRCTRNKTVNDAGIKPFRTVNALKPRLELPSLKRNSRVDVDALASPRNPPHLLLPLFP